MKFIAAYLLAQLGGNSSPSADDIKDILSSVGAEADEDRISHLLSQVEGKDIVEVIAEGKDKFASVPTGGAMVAAGGGAAPAGSAPAVAETAKEAPKKEEEPQEESDDDMGLSLFD